MGIEATQLKKIQALFEEAITLNGPARAEYLQRVANSEPKLYAELQSLLEADAQNSNFTGNLADAVAGSAHGPSSADGLVGRQIGPYSILAEIGRGAMGIVYQAEDTRLGRHVALKFLVGSRLTPANSRERFLTEAKAVSRLDHPSICTLYDIGASDDGLCYLAMAYYEGETLDKAIARAAPTFGDSIRWIQQIADGLHYAHEEGVIHRDLKAANVFLRVDGQIRILDFGVAKLQGVDLTDTGFRIGTVAYMAPEQILGENVDRRSDIWSLGVLTHELLVGFRPFRAESSSMMTGQILHATIEPPSSKASWLPRSVDRLVMRCLARDRSERYQTLAGLLEDLEIISSLARNDGNLASRQAGTSASGAQDPEILTHVSELESRQITVVSCRFDGSDSRAMAAELVLGLQRYCEAYALSEGIAYIHSVDSLITLCFGYPQTYEDNAERAIRAAVELRTELSRELREHPGTDIGQGAIRIAIHTGDVIVDGTGNTTTGLIQRFQGDAHVLAMRLIEAAAPGDIVLSDATLGLLHIELPVEPAGRIDGGDAGRSFDVYRLTDDLLDTPGRDFCWHFDRALLGRKAECAILDDAWEAVLEGEGRVVAIRGEPGIGKTRLMQRMVERCSRTSKTVVLQCTTVHENSFLYPFRYWLRHALAERMLDGQSPTLADVTGLASAAGIDSPTAIEMLAGLLDIDSGARESGDPSLNLAEVIREETLTACVDLICNLAARQPLLLIAEDLHWSDTGTLELLSRLADQGTSVPILLLLSLRPGVDADWIERSHIVAQTLGRLSRAQSIKLARKLLRERETSDDIVERIASHSDGVPLYIEELCQAVLAGAGDMVPPDTLRDSLMSRLDREPAFKPIAQLAAIIGREFGYELLREVWTGDADTLDSGLDFLMRSEVLFRKGAGPKTRYVFKHALLQDTAYASLLPTTRQAYHGLVASAIEQAFPDVAEAEPEVVATHWARAGDGARAARAWLAAARQALRRSALADAIVHARSGLDQMQRLDDAPEVLSLELELLMTIGPALMAHYSWSKDEVQQTYQRAQEICDALGNAPELFPVLHGLYTYNCVVGNHLEGQSLNGLCMSIAERSGDAGLMLEARMLRGITHFFFGEIEPAAEILAKGLAAYDRETFGDHCYIYGQDPGMLTSSYLALCLAMIGNSEDATALSKRSVAATRDLGHPFSLCIGLSFASWLALMLGDTDRGLDIAEEAKSLSAESSTAIMLGMSQLLIGWARIQHGHAARALIDIEDGISQFDALGTSGMLPLWHGLLALALQANGDAPGALQAIDRGQQLAEAAREHWSTSELHRWRAAVLLETGARKHARASLRAAIALAGRQGATLFKERAEADLARMKSSKRLHR